MPNGKDDNNSQSVINGQTVIKLSIGQIIMVATMIATLAGGWATLKWDQDSMKQALAGQSQALSSMNVQINQIREDVIRLTDGAADDRKETRRHYPK